MNVCVNKKSKQVEKISRHNILFQLSQLPGTTIVLNSPDLDLSVAQSFIDSLNKSIAQTSRKELIVFIHGCCESPQQSLANAALLSLYCNSPVLLIDWDSPSVRRAGILTYMQSDRGLELSQLYFGSLMQQLQQKIVSKHINLIAYSLGAKLVRDYLRQYPAAFIDQIHYVRPDISLPVFLLEQNKIQKQFGHMYVYTSNHDLNLQLSQSLMSAGIPRLGMQSHLSHQFSNCPENITIIDTSNLRKSSDLCGHDLPFEALRCH